jgi:hypothetical protein
MLSLLKKYLVFTYYAGRPLGGVKDYLDSFGSLREALDNILDEPMRYFQIVDRDTMRPIREGLARFKNFSSEGFSSDKAGAES